MRARFRSTVSFLVLVVLASACTDARKQDILAQDTSLMREMSLANADTAAQPQLMDVPMITGPVVTEPVAADRVRAPARRVTSPRAISRGASVERPVVTANGNVVTEGKAGSEPAVGVIPAGETLELFSGQRVCTNTTSVGDRFTAMLHEAVVGANGATIPAGATAVVEVVASRRATSANEAVQLDLVVRSLTVNGRTYQIAGVVSAAQIERVRAETRSDDVRKVATGAAIGAIAGQIFGKKTRSTVVGAATGAAAGAVYAATSANFEGCVPSGGRIAIRLTEPLYVQL